MRKSSSKPAGVEGDATEPLLPPPAPDIAADAAPTIVVDGERGRRPSIDEPWLARALREAEREAGSDAFGAMEKAVRAAREERARIEAELAAAPSGVYPCLECCYKGSIALAGAVYEGGTLALEGFLVKTYWDQGHPQWAGIALASLVVHYFFSWLALGTWMRVYYAEHVDRAVKRVGSRWARKPADLSFVNCCGVPLRFRFRRVPAGHIFENLRGWPWLSLCFAGFVPGMAAFNLARILGEAAAAFRGTRWCFEKGGARGREQLYLDMRSYVPQYLAAKAVFVSVTQDLPQAALKALAFAEVPGDWGADALAALAVSAANVAARLARTAYSLASGARAADVPFFAYVRELVVPEGGAPLHAVHTNTAVTLSQPALEAADLERLVRLLGANDSVEVLDLSRAGSMTPRNAALFGRLVVEQPKPLAELNLDDNPLGPSGAAALALSLAGSKVRLRVLEMSRCGIGDGGAALLAAALGRNINLEVLALRADGIGDTGARALAGVLDRPAMQLLDLRANAGISAEGRKALFDGVDRANKDPHRLRLPRAGPVEVLVDGAAPKRGKEPAAAPAAAKAPPKRK